MPYNPPYMITPKITDLVAKISEAVEAHVFNQKDLSLYRINRIKAIQGSLAIDGNSLTTDQIDTILDGKPVIAPINDLQEIRNAIKVYEMLDELDPNSINDLLKAHLSMERGLIDDAGTLRHIGHSMALSGKIKRYAPPGSHVPILMRDLFHWFNQSEEHPLIKSSVLHYELVFIQPFSDGNGRIARLWQKLILSKWRHIFINLPFENIIYKYSKEYHKSIEASGGEVGCTPFIEFLLSIVDEALTIENS